MSLLKNIKESTDIRLIPEEMLDDLAEEIRQEILSFASETGGHVASNLGIVELTIALHRVFDIPQDKIIWDVGHQCYVHKMLTGRAERMRSLRQYKGIAGFPKRSESSADAFGAGHASTSISAALGLAVARDHLGARHKVVAVIGDGALTGGLAYEGLNNAGAMKKDMLVVLNENDMSISKNVGAMAKYLTSIMADQRFNKLRDDVWELTGRFKRRDKIRALVSQLEDSFKGLFTPGYLFDKLGFRYFGPIDGHDIALLIKTFNQIKNLSGPLLLHVLTKKGKGYKPAESDATKFHGIGAFDKVTGKASSDGLLPSYTKIYGDTMLELGEKNKRVVAITAAMTSGVGLNKFAERFPERFYDVGIAEAHAACFAAAMAAEGMRPFVAIYSTFLQRAYDQIIHDAALQNLPVVYCIDRAGLVGEDGPTHHGCFDVSYLSAVPNMSILSPKDGDELRSMLHLLADMSLNGPCAIRYPRANIPYKMTNVIDPIDWGKWEILQNAGETVIIATGAMVDTAMKTWEIIDHNFHLSVINARFLKPMDTHLLEECLDNYKCIVTIEEGSLIGGLGQQVGQYLSAHGFKGQFKSYGIPDNFIEHGHRSILLENIGLTPEILAHALLDLVPARKSFVSRLTFKSSKKNGHPESKKINSAEIKAANE